MEKLIGPMKGNFGTTRAHPEEKAQKKKKPPRDIIRYNIQIKIIWGLKEENKRRKKWKKTKGRTSQIIYPKSTSNGEDENKEEAESKYTVETNNDKTTKDPQKSKLDESTEETKLDKTNIKEGKNNGRD